MGENIHCFQYHLTVSWVFFLSLWGHWQSQSLSALLSTLSWLQGPEYKKEWQPSFGEDWGEVSVSLQQTELLALAVPCQPHLLSSLPRRRTQGTYKPFRLLFCSTLNVPQVANNMRLFSPWDGTQQGCEPGVSVRVLLGAFLLSRSQQAPTLENAGEHQAGGGPTAQGTQPQTDSL